MSSQRAQGKSPASLPRWGDRRRARIGLLGGSFNPAHDGHRHIAEAALSRLRLDQIWLLVSPGNPLKPRAGMAPLAARMASARSIIHSRRIVATDIEAALRTRYTVDTVLKLRQLFPRISFVWLMGSDNLEQLPRWRRWRSIVATVPFAVMPRPAYNHRALAGLAARRLRPFRKQARQAVSLAESVAPSWVFLDMAQHPASATSLRAAGITATTSGAGR